MANKDALSKYLEEFMAEQPVLNRGLRAGSTLRPISGQPGMFSVGLEALYGDELSAYDTPKLQVPETYVSGLEASPVVALDTGSELTIKAVQIFLNLSGYKGADKKALSEDGTWGKNTAFALSAWQKANAGKAGVTEIKVNQGRGVAWMPSNISGVMRAKLSLTERGQKELARSPAPPAPKRAADSRNAIPSSTEAQASPGNLFETAANVRAILRALDVPVAAAGLVDSALVQGWQRAAKAFKLNPAVSAQEGASKLEVNAATLGALRTKARANRPSTAAATQAAANAGTLPVQTTEVQRVLRALGFSKSVAADGKYGAKTKAAWESAATKRGLDNTIAGGAGAGLVNVNSATLARLQQDASIGNSKGTSTVAQSVTKPVLSAPAPKPVTPLVATGGTQIVPTRTVQAILIKLRWAKTGLTDGKYGTRTKTAWQKSATNRGVDPQIVAGAGGTSVIVSADTLARLTRDAQMGYVNPPYGPSGAVATDPTPVVPVVPVVPVKKPAGKDAETPPKSGLSKVQVGTLQDILLKLKFSVGKTGRDGMWGSSTQKAWATAAKNRTLDPTITRASPVEAWVSPATLEQLSLAATGKAVQPNVPVSQPSVGDKELVAVETKAIGPILSAFGKPMPKKAAELLRSWKEIAASEKLDARASTKNVAGALVLYAPRPTADALVKESNLRIDVAKIVKASNTPVLMATVQDALTFWSNKEPVKAQYGQTYTPKSRTQWDAKTASWMLRYLNIPKEGISTWERALPILVASDKKSIKLPSSFVPAFGTDAANFKSVKTIIKKKNAKAAKNAATEAKLASAIDKQVRASNVVAPVVTLQQALNELYLKQQTGLIPKTPLLEPVARNGKWDAPTYRMFLAAYGRDALGKVPAGLMNDLLERLLVNTPASGVAGFGEVIPGAGRSYIRVTPAMAKLIAEDAKAWAARTKEVLTPLVIVGNTEPTPLIGGNENSRTPEWLQNQTQPEPVPSPYTPAGPTPVMRPDSPVYDNQDQPGPAPIVLQPEQPQPAGPEPVDPGTQPAGPTDLLPPAPAPAPSGTSPLVWLLGAGAALAIGAAMSNKKQGQGVPTQAARRARR